MKNFNNAETFTKLIANCPAKISVISRDIAYYNLVKIATNHTGELFQRFEVYRDSKNQKYIYDELLKGSWTFISNKPIVFAQTENYIKKAEYLGSQNQSKLSEIKTKILAEKANHNFRLPNIYELASLTTSPWIIDHMRIFIPPIFLPENYSDIQHVGHIWSSTREEAREDFSWATWFFNSLYGRPRNPFGYSLFKVDSKHFRYHCLLFSPGKRLA